MVPRHDGRGSCSSGIPATAPGRSLNEHATSKMDSAPPAAPGTSSSPPTTTTAVHTPARRRRRHRREVQHRHEPRPVNPGFATSNAPAVVGNPSPLVVPTTSDTRPEGSTHDPATRVVRRLRPSDGAVDEARTRSGPPSSRTLRVATVQALRRSASAVVGKSSAPPSRTSRPSRTQPRPVHRGSRAQSSPVPPSRVLYDQRPPPRRQPVTNASPSQRRWRCRRRPGVVGNRLGVGVGPAA